MPTFDLSRGATFRRMRIHSVNHRPILVLLGGMKLLTGSGAGDIKRVAPTRRTMSRDPQLTGPTFIGRIAFPRNIHATTMGKMALWNFILPISVVCWRVLYGSLFNSMIHALQLVRISMVPQHTASLTVRSPRRIIYIIRNWHKHRCDIDDIALEDFGEGTRDQGIEGKTEHKEAKQFLVHAWKE